MIARIKAVGNRIDLDGPTQARLPFDAPTRERVEGWLSIYRRATQYCQRDSLSILGREMFEWLDTEGWASTWVSQPGPRFLEIGADAEMTDSQRALLSLPWELLSGRAGALALDLIQSFQVWRRIGAASAPRDPGNGDLSLLFMAGAPMAVEPQLNYEEEESAILRATRKLKLNLTVEESGCPDLLAENIALSGRYDALHLSCHGALLDKATAVQYAQEGAEEGPNLLLETEVGARFFAPPHRLARCWIGNEPDFLFLSACRTSWDVPDAAQPLTMQLVRSVPNVLGWAGSVYDDDAIQFAELLYKELSKHQTIVVATTLARHSLLIQYQNGPGGASPGAHWHLAQLWLGPEGGGRLCRPGGQQRRLPGHVWIKPRLDANNERGKRIAGPLTFVGRRRQTQSAIAALRQDTFMGLLLLGMGNIGKSSLAHRICTRLPHLQKVLIFNDYDASAVFAELVRAMAPELRRPFEDVWLPGIKAEPEIIGCAIEAALSGPFADTPIVMIIDDLEQILENPSPDSSKTVPKTENGWRATLAGIFDAFERARGDSRLIITSRFDFELLKAGEDRAIGLCRIHLHPFNRLEQDKQWRAEVNARLHSSDSAMRAGVERAVQDTRVEELRLEAASVAEGLPGLQDILSAPLLAGEIDPVRDAIDAVRRYKQAGTDIPPEENKAFEFFRRMAFETYKASLSDDENCYLRASGLFGDNVWAHSKVSAVALAALDRAFHGVVAVPGAALDAVGAANGSRHPQRTRQKLVGLGLIDVYSFTPRSDLDEGYLVNPFARPIVGGLDETQRKILSTAAFPVLEDCWRCADGSWPRDDRSIEALRIALLSGDPK